MRLELIIFTGILISGLYFFQNDAYAQTTYNINIPTGAASPDAPFFWQVEIDGTTTGDIQIQERDTVMWNNGDTAVHTVTSGTVEEGPDGIFDSGLFAPGDSFSYTFMEIGKYPYFCVVHPWMIGIVTVGSGLDIIPNVGSDAGDGLTTFDVEYLFNRVISEAKIDESQKAITFTIVGVAKSDDHTLTMLLPKNLINDPYVIWADGNQISDFELDSEGGVNTISFALNEKTEQVTIVGSSVVPEFGTIAILIFASSILPIILARKNGMFLNFTK